MSTPRSLPSLRDLRAAVGPLWGGPALGDSGTGVPPSSVLLPGGAPVKTGTERGWDAPLPWAGALEATTATGEGSPSPTVPTLRSEGQHTSALALSDAVAAVRAGRRDATLMSDRNAVRYLSTSLSSGSLK